jgi:hypothetical protein
LSVAFLSPPPIRQQRPPAKAPAAFLNTRISLSRQQIDEGVRIPIYDTEYFPSTE